MDVFLKNEEKLSNQCAVGHELYSWSVFQSLPLNSMVRWFLHRSKNFLNHSLRGLWAGAKSFRASQQYFILESERGSGNKRGNTNMHTKNPTFIQRQRRRTNTPEVCTRAQTHFRRGFNVYEKGLGTSIPQ